MITVVGCDGRPLPPAAEAALAGSTLVVGARRQLAAVPAPRHARVVEIENLDAALDAVTCHHGDAVVLASGDPGFFGIVRALRSRGAAPTVLPAASSVTCAFARIGLPWDDAVVVSAHGRALRPAVNVCRAHPKVAVLTAPEAGPAQLGAALMDTDRVLVVAEDLGGDERLTRCLPHEAVGRRWTDPNVVLVLDETRVIAPRGWLAGRVPARGWALPDDVFEHRAGMVTKAEVRAFVLARLAPRLGDLVWDVGAGSGSVAVECARLGAAAIALDRDADACAIVARNAARNLVDVTVVHGAAPAALAELPDPDAVFVGGGGPDVVAATVTRAPARLVVALAAVQRLEATQRALSQADYRVDGVVLQASRLASLPGGVHRLAPVNPVLLVIGERS